MSTGPRILEWYRADSWPRMRRVLLMGPAILTLGGLVIAVSFITGQPRHVRVTATLAGFGLVAAGAAFTLVGMHRILRNEVSLVLRTDGVLVQSASAETFVAWDDLVAARWDAQASCLVLERSSGEPVLVTRPRVPAGGLQLAARIIQQKRRLALSLPGDLPR